MARSYGEILSTNLESTSVCVHVCGGGGTAEFSEKNEEIKEWTNSSKYIYLSRSISSTYRRVENLSPMAALVFRS